MMPRRSVLRAFLRPLLVLALFGQVCGATFEDYNEFYGAVRGCLVAVPTGAQCCSSGRADCGRAGTTDMPDWDVSNILTMKMLFFNADAFKEDISRWDVSQVQSMTDMFFGAVAFDADITSWDTSSLVASENMFLSATAWYAKFERKMNVGVGPRDGPPSAWQKRDLPPLSPSPPHLESPPPPARAVSSPPPAPGSVPEVSPPPAPAYDPPTTSVGVGTVVLVAFIMLVIGFVSGYLVRLLRSNQGVPILDEEPEEEIFERAGYTSS
jgi:surface protein